MPVIKGRALQIESGGGMLLLLLVSLCKENVAALTYRKVYRTIWGDGRCPQLPRLSGGSALTVQGS